MPMTALRVLGTRRYVQGHVFITPQRSDPSIHSFAPTSSNPFDAAVGGAQAGDGMTPQWPLVQSAVNCLGEAQKVTTVHNIPVDIRTTRDALALRRAGNKI